MTAAPHSRTPADGAPLLDPYWKYRHAAACLWPTIKLTAAEVASYDETMALDRKIRTFPVPAHLQASLQGSEVWQWSTDAGQAVQQYCIVADKELSRWRCFRPMVHLLTGTQIFSSCTGTTWASPYTPKTL